MTSEVTKNMELISIQSDLSNAIQKHQKILAQLHQDCDGSLKKELNLVQMEIQRLGEIQKKLIKGIKKDENSSSESNRANVVKKEEFNKVSFTSNGDSKHQLIASKLEKTCRKPSTFQHIKKPIRMEINRKINGPALAVRTISGQTKLLVPVSAAAATAKKQNQPKQILVVPTPGGGARLATSATGQASLLRPQRLDTRYSKNDNCDYLSSTSSKHINNIIESYHQKQQQLKEQYLKAKREEDKIPEAKRKETFLAALGLLTMKALSEIQNKKYERKRRTTANPQFSNAAIEAKRITAMEIAAKRAKKREMMLAAAEKSAHHRESKRLHTISAASFSSSSRHSNNRSLLKSNCSIEKSSSQFVTKVRPILPIRSLSSSSSAINHNSKVSNLQVSKPIRKPKSLKKCYVCDELCDPELDAIMLCKDCRFFFHATCVSTVDDINKTNSVPCPICDKKTSQWSSTPETDFDSFLNHFSKSRHVLREGEDDEEKSGTEGGEKMEKILNQEDEENMKEFIATRSRDQLMNKSVKEKTSILSKTKLNSNVFNIKREKKESLLNRQKELSKVYSEEKNKITQLNLTFKKLKEDKKSLLIEQNKVKESIEKLKKIIKLIQETNQDKKISKSSVDSNEKEKLKEGKSLIEKNWIEDIAKENVFIEKKDNDENSLKNIQVGQNKSFKGKKEENSNLIIIDNEPVILDKSNQYEDETSAAVASIQDQMDTDSL